MERVDWSPRGLGIKERNSKEVRESVKELYHKDQSIDECVSWGSSAFPGYWVAALGVSLQCLAHISCCVLRLFKMWSIEHYCCQCLFYNLVASCDQFKFVSWYCLFCQSPRMLISIVWRVLNSTMMLMAVFVNAKPSFLLYRGHRYRLIES